MTVNGSHMDRMLPKIGFEVSGIHCEEEKEEGNPLGSKKVKEYRGIFNALDVVFEKTQNFDFIIVPIAFKSKFIIREKNEKIVGRLTTSGCLADIEKEFIWANYLCLNHVVISLSQLLDHGTVLHHFASFFGHLLLASNPSLTIHVQINPFKHFSFWKALQGLLNFHIQLKLGLDLNHFKDDSVSNDQLRLWLIEPLGMILLNSNILYSKCIIEKNCPLVVTNNDPIHDISFESLTKNIRIVHNQLPMYDFSDKSILNYEDVLQIPLQPLKDNLHSEIYEAFEKDKVKYELYEKAIFNALMDHQAKSGLQLIIVFVVGAGRGPLIDCVLRASMNAHIHVQIYANDKNPNAIIVLENRLLYEWKEYDIHIIKGDMRLLKLGFKVDILISELLGSFGDNELAPECIHHAMENLLKVDGICIPQSYTSYLTPIYHPKLYSMLLYMKKDAPDAFERPYVCHLKDMVLLSKDIKPIFTFSHTSHELIRDDFNCLVDISFLMNESLSNMDLDVHGFAGFFDCILYNTVTLSIHPQWHTYDMYSWFPFFLPLEKPFKWNSQYKSIHLSIWRYHKKDLAVWYEWAILNEKIQNIGGKSYSISMNI